MMLRTGIDSRILKLESSALPPGIIGLIATRYEAPFMPWPSCTLSRSVIFDSHCATPSPASPVNQSQRAAVDILQRLAVHGPHQQALLLMALAIGTPRDRVCCLVSPERCTSVP